MFDSRGGPLVAAEISSQLELPPKTRHICLFVREPARFNLALLPLMTTLLSVEATVVLAFNQVETRLSSLLTEPVVQHLAATGRLIEQSFDITTVLKRWADLSLDLGAAGQPLVIIGEISWAMQQQPGFDLAHYEAGLDKLLVEQPTISLLVCIYDADNCNGEMALTAFQTHPAIVIDGVCRAGLGFPRKG